MDEASQEPGEVADVLFYCALRLHLRDASPDEAEDHDEDTEQ